MVASDKPHAAHVGRQGVYFFHACGDTKAVLKIAEVESPKLVGNAGFIFGRLEVHASNPVPSGFEVLDQMMADESPCPGNQDFYRTRHHRTPLLAGACAFSKQVPRTGIGRLSGTRGAPTPRSGLS